LEKWAGIVDAGYRGGLWWYWMPVTTASGERWFLAEGLGESHAAVVAADVEALHLFGLKNC
jgi:hypothetical protein